MVQQQPQLEAKAATAAMVVVAAPVVSVGLAVRAVAAFMSSPPWWVKPVKAATVGQAEAVVSLGMVPLELLVIPSISMAAVVAMEAALVPVVTAVRQQQAA